MRGLGMLVAGLGLAQPGLAAPATNGELAAKAAAPASAGPKARFAVLPKAPGCISARRKLWVEGEGWIVRRVPLCP